MKYVAEEHTQNQNQQFDQVQLLLQRRQEKAKYVLTEEDANLLLSHSVEKTYTDGQVIIETGAVISEVYRVKSGKVAFNHNGSNVEFTKGWFIGEHLFLTNKPYTSFKTMKAVGTVVLYQLNTAFVKQLLEIDTTLSVKFFKYLASKYASLFHRISSALLSPDDAEVTSVVSTKSNHKRSTKQQAYKVYPVVSIRECCNGVQTIGLTPKGIQMIAKSFGFKWRVMIDFSKFQSAVANGNTAITIVHDSNKSTTVVFKHFADREEFIKLVSSITSLDVLRTPRSASPITEKQEDEDVDADLDMKMFQTLQITKEYKKGDKVVEEGDLYQRVIMLGSGTFDICRNNKVVHTLQPDQMILGVSSLLYLRPVSATLVVTSEVATVHIIPAYKIAELVKSDPRHARQLYLAAAKHLQKLVLNLFEVSGTKPPCSVSN